jgi:hypothetical protein
MLLLERSGERLERRERLGVALLGPRGAEFGPNPWPLVFGELIADVARLVDLMPTSA